MQIDSRKEYVGDDADSMRFKVFQITPDDLALVRQLAPFAREKLPHLLQEWLCRFDAWPEMRKALSHPDVHAIRVQHWVRAVSGQIDGEFTVSAKRLARAFYDNNVPGYAVAICHNTVMNGIVEELGLAVKTNGIQSLLGRNEERRKDALRVALTKLTWLDLELLLETYAEAERESRQNALEAMADTVEREARDAVSRVASHTTEMAGDAESMANSALRVGVNSRDVAAAADQALNNAQTVAAATEELAASIRDILQRVGHSGQVTRRAVASGNRTQATIRSLSEAVGKIGEVARLIGAIAGQTNLLALNATIEAARAGEAGKGFAVVAQEVKNLANQTARSTDEIARQIGEIESVTAAAVSAVEEIGITIDEIDRVSGDIAAAMEQQAEATQEISRSLIDTSNAAREVSDRIGAVSSEAVQTGTQAAQVQKNAHEVAESIEALRRVLVRVVRTSTDEADRRQFERFDVDEPCVFESGGRRCEGRIVNVSTGGARIAGTSGIGVGDTGVVTLGRRQLRVRATVLGLEDDCAHVTFEAAMAKDTAFVAALAAMNRVSRPARVA
ncbi:hypothetical protein [Azospirillum doebereinerae]